VPTPAELDAERFFTDLAMPGDDGVLVTASGDWPIVSGRANLRSAVEQRAITMPGELVHRPQYGAGAAEFVETTSTPAKRAELVARLRENLLRDRRIGDVGARVAVRDGQTEIELSIQPRGQSETESVGFTLGG